MPMPPTSWHDDTLDLQHPDMFLGFPECLDISRSWRCMHAVSKGVNCADISITKLEV
jgi:hypothetical protein